jgi:molybdopterin synthase catalytic subunit
MAVTVQEADFDVGAELAALTKGRSDIGGVASFIGLVRDSNDGASVSAMTLEHYPAMTEKQLQAIEREAGQRWDLIDVRLIHRVGRLVPGDQIVLVLVASAHRHAAFEACAFLADWLKTKAPFWKKEETPDGQARWVAARASDEAAAERWAARSADR